MGHSAICSIEMEERVCGRVVFFFTSAAVFNYNEDNAQMKFPPEFIRLATLAKAISICTMVAVAQNEQRKEKNRVV